MDRSPVHKMSRAKYYCFTSYAATLPTELPSGVTYLVYQREICPDTGREHFQGYLELEARQRLAGVRRVLGDPAVHVEVRRGTSQQAADYAKKEESRKPGTVPVELGEQSTVVQGQRTDLLAVKKLLDEGATEREIADEQFSTWAKYYRAIERYKRLQVTVRDWKTELYIICGDTGVGKSRICRETYPEAYWKPRGSWWCGYDSHETVVIDDFYGWLPWDLLLRLTDRYPLLVETKGGSVQFVAKRVIITSNKTYTDWYSMDPAPLTRRVTKYSWIGEGQQTSADCLTAGGESS